MAAAIRIPIVLLLFLHVSTAQKQADGSIHTPVIMLLNLQSLISLLLLGLSVVLSASIYLWVLRYVCIGCCQPIAVGAESEALVGYKMTFLYL